MMVQSKTGSGAEVIRITVDEANSPHIDDLLKRQASLRGEGGIARDRGGSWFYQNWFVLMIAGTLAALAGWAILEPFFDDLFYIQGTITSVAPGGSIAVNRPGASGQVNLSHLTCVTIGEDKVYVSNTATRWIQDGGRTYAPLDPRKLKAGDSLGVHVNITPSDDDAVQVPLAIFAVANPPPSPRPLPDLQHLASRHTAAGMLLFPLVAALVGLAIGAADGLMCRLLRRAVVGGAVGLLVGFIGGFISAILANLIYMPLTKLAMNQGGAVGGLTTFGFIIQTGGRGLAWCLAGMAMGLGQGLALRSKRLLLYGFLGGLIGGLLGGLLFDPLDLLILGRDKLSAHWSRLVGLGVIGATVGSMIGIVERLARDAWLRMVQGPLTGKEFLIFKDVMRMGSSPRSELYLFNDTGVAPQHAILRSSGDTYEIENTCSESPVCVNGRPVQRARLRHGDRISMGRTAFVFQRQRAE